MDAVAPAGEPTKKRKEKEKKSLKKAKKHDDSTGNIEPTSNEVPSHKADHHMRVRTMTEIRPVEQRAPLTERSLTTKGNLQLLGSYTLLRPNNDKSHWWDCYPKNEIHELDMSIKGRKPMELLANLPVKPTPNEELEQELYSWDRNFENYEYILSTLNIRDTPKQLFFFPQKDITVELKKQNRPHLFSNVEYIPTHVKVCLDFFTKDLLQIHHNNSHYGACRSQHETINAFRARLQKKNALVSSSSFPIPLSPSSASSSSLSNSDRSLSESSEVVGFQRQFLPHLMKQCSDDQGKSETNERKTSHDSIFQNFNPDEILAVRSDTRIMGDPFSSKSAFQVIIELKGVGFTIGTAEPFWVELAFYDLDRKIRVTESFHFEFNDSDSHKSQLQYCRDTSVPIDSETTSRTCIFTFNRVSENIHLVVRVNRVLKGDVDTVCEPYLKGTTMTEKEKEKWISETQKCISTLGRYRQPMAWGTIPAFTRNGKLALKESFCEVPLLKMKPMLTDEALYESGGETAKQQKFLDGRVVLNAKQFVAENYVFANLVDDSLHKQPSTARSEEDISQKVIDKPVKIIANLDKSQSSIPEVFYVNNLYIYPELLNLTSFPSKLGKVKHVLIRVCLLTSDEKGIIDKYGLKAIYGKSFGPNFSHTIDLPVNWNTKCPQFFDEVKIKLPNKIEEKLHLLFIFYNINAKLKKSSDKPETVLGYSFLSILNPDKRILDDTLYILPVYHELPANYLTGSSEPIKGDAKSPVQFSLKTKLISSIFSQDKALDNLFKSRDNIDVSVVENLPHARMSDLLRFFPIVYNHLFFHLMNNQSANIQQITFRSLINVTHLVAENSEKEKEQEGEIHYNTYLVSYLNYHFEGHTNFPTTSTPPATPTSTNLDSSNILPNNSDIPLYERIIKHWLILRNEADLMSDVRTLLSYTMHFYPYYFFGLITRDITLKLHQSGNLDSPDFQTDRPSTILSADCKSDLLKLIKAFAELPDCAGPYHATSNAASLSGTFNTHLALFLSDLFGLVDRGFVFTLVHAYIRGLNAKKKTDDNALLKLQFLKIISEYEHYVPLVVPLQDTIDTARALNLKFWKHHYLTGYLLNEISEIDTTKPELRQKAVKILRNLLWKHDMDERYSESEPRELLANIYIPHLKFVLKNLKIFIKEDAELAEQREWVVTAMYILRYCNSNLVREWIILEDVETLSLFLDFFTFAIDTYKSQAGPRVSAQEQKMLAEISIITLDYIEYIMQDFYAELQTEEFVEIFNRISFLLLHLIRLPSYLSTHPEIPGIPPTLVFVILSSTLRNFIFKFKTAMFRFSQSPFTVELSSDLLAKCFDESSLVCNSAMSLIYAILKANWDCMGEFLRMKLCLTIAASKIDVKQFPQLKTLITIFKDEAAKEDSKFRKEWLLHIKDIFGRIYRSMYYVQTFPTVEDPELKAEYLYNLSLENIHSIDQRVKWLNKLAAYHAELENWEEVGQCKVIVAALIAALLGKKSEQDTSFFPQTFDAFRLVAPNIIYELPIRDESRIEILSPIFHEKGYMDTLDEAIAAMVKANVFEEGVELLSILFQLHKSTGGFSKLATVGKQLWELAENATKANESNTRIFNKYYRVVFYGKKFGELDNQKYVYRESGGTRLVDYQSRMEKQFSHMIGEDVKTVPNKPKEELNLDPSGHYIQIISVDPFQDTDRFKTKRDITTFDKQHAVDKYGYEAPWGGPNGGKLTDEVGKQWKIRTIFVLPCAYPHVLRRMKVCDEKSIQVGPIDCAIDLIDSRIETIKLELQLRPPNTKTLQNVLQGSIMLQVNAGPKAIIQYFLHPDQVKQFEHKKIVHLKEKLTEFMRKCDFALKLNKSLIEQDQPEHHRAMQEHQKAMQEHFSELKKLASPYLDF